MKSTVFENLEIPEKQTSHISRNRYRVYENTDAFVVVEAENAKEALAASGLKDAHRIMRDALIFHNVVKVESPPIVVEPEPLSEPQLATAEETQPPAPSAEEVVAPIAPAAPEEPLSPDDVDQLLKS